jgi:uncharacterized protein YjbI with pentapeptide repeats
MRTAKLGGVDEWPIPAGPTLTVPRTPPMSDAERSERRQANDNAWYRLATVYGEQPAHGNVDVDLAAKNRMAWNRWMVEVLSNEQRADLVRNGFSEAELVPFTPAEKTAFCNDFASRTGRGGVLPPNPEGVVDFTNTQFDNLVIFSGFLYIAKVDFRSATFSANANFESAGFSGNADFESVTFSGSTDFESAAFSGTADFESVTFSGTADFESATFSGYTYFGSARFSGDAYFRSARFSDYTIFGSATFSGYADFESATFCGYADFESVTFSDDVDFSSATFAKNADFINAGFTASAVFAHARFGPGVPDFRGAKMHEATEWHGVTWPLAPHDKDDAQAQVYAYERLKQEMERLKKHEDEQFFFRKELRARRGLIPRWRAAWLLNYAYQVSSDYGQSIAKPFFWLVGLFLLGGVFFAAAPVFKGTPMTILGAAGLSFANIFSFLPVRREIMTDEIITGLSSAAQIAGVVQSLLGLVLLFLLGLALRSRFRMR